MYTSEYSSKHFLNKACKIETQWGGQGYPYVYVHVSSPKLLNEFQ